MGNGHEGREVRRFEVSNPFRSITTFILMSSKNNRPMIVSSPWDEGEVTKLLAMRISSSRLFQVGHRSRRQTLIAAHLGAARGGNFHS